MCVVQQRGRGRGAKYTGKLGTKSKVEFIILWSVRACVRESGRARLPLDSTVTERKKCIWSDHSLILLMECIWGDSTIISYQGEWECGVGGWIFDSEWVNGGGGRRWLREWQVSDDACEPPGLSVVYDHWQSTVLLDLIRFHYYQLTNSIPTSQFASFLVTITVYSVD